MKISVNIKCENLSKTFHLRDLSLYNNKKLNITSIDQ